MKKQTKEPLVLNEIDIEKGLSEEQIAERQKKDM